MKGNGVQSCQQHIDGDLGPEAKHSRKSSVNIVN